MKKIFAGLALAILMFVGSPRVFANHIPMPNLPIGETAVEIKDSHESCGEVVDYFFIDTRHDIVVSWIVVTLNGRWLGVINALTKETWLDRNLDGHLDEYSTIDAVEKKYPTICSVVEKGVQE